MKKPFAWSYSTLSRYELCPKKQYHLGVLKDFKDADSEASSDGKHIHQVLHDRVLKDKPLPVPLRHLDPMAKRFADMSGEMHGEMQLALDRALNQVGYFDPGVWVRALVDLLVVPDPKTAIVVDWKTGKRKEDFTQLDITVAVLSQIMPEVETFKAMLVWTQTKQISPKIYSRAMLKEVWNGLLPRVGAMEMAYHATDYPARENPLCGWCPVNTCPHWIER